MNIDDMFRHFFGFSDFQRNARGDLDEDNCEGICPEEFGGQHFYSDSFKFPFGIMRHFEEMFRNFGLAEFPPIGPHMREIEPPSDREMSPRDKMLRRDRDLSPKFHQPWYEGNLENPGSCNTHKEDSDLDKKVSEGGLGALVMPRPPTMETKPWSYFSSVSIRTIRGADGKMEEHRTVRDSSGKEETTVRRIIGNESHSVTTINDKDGLKEKKEDLVNMDESGLRDFNRKWEIREHPLQTQPRDESYNTIFKKLFGFLP